MKTLKLLLLAYTIGIVSVTIGLQFANANVGIVLANPQNLNVGQICRPGIDNCMGQSICSLTQRNGNEYKCNAVTSENANACANDPLKVVAFTCSTLSNGECLQNPVDFGANQFSAAVAHVNNTTGCGQVDTVSAVTGKICGDFQVINSRCGSVQNTPTSTPPAVIPPVVPPAGVPGLTILKQTLVTRSYLVGQTASFSVRITNTGQTTLNAVNFTDTFNPAYLRYLNASGVRTGSNNVNIGAVATVNTGTGTFSIANLATSLGSLAPGQSYLLQFSFLTLAPINNTVNTARAVSGNINISSSDYVVIGNVDTDL